MMLLARGASTTPADYDRATRKARHCERRGNHARQGHRRATIRRNHENVQRPAAGHRCDNAGRIRRAVIPAGEIHMHDAPKRRQYRRRISTGGCRISGGDRSPASLGLFGSRAGSSISDLAFRDR